MAKIGFITDTHWGQHNDNKVFYDYMKKSCEYYFEVFAEEQVHTVIHGGDVVDRRKYINYVTAQHLREDFLDPLSQRFEKVYFICGNHDVYYKDTNKVNALNILRLNDYPNFTVFESDPAEIVVDNTKVLLLPWITIDNEQAAMEAISTTDAQTCIGHLEVMGFDHNQYGSPAEHGLTKFQLEKFESVYTGHFHHPSYKKPVRYVGAAFELDWLDYNDPRGVTIIDTETHTSKFYRNPLQLFQVYYYEDDTADGIALIKQDLERGHFKRFANSFVKLKVKSKKDDMLYEEVYKQITDAQPASFKAIDLFESDEEQPEIDLSNVDSTQTILKRYVEKRISDNLKKEVESNVNLLYNEAIQLENIIL